MKFGSHRVSLTGIAILTMFLLISGCAQENTIYVDDYSELRPYTTTLLSNTQPAPDDQARTDDTADDGSTDHASAGGA